MTSFGIPLWLWQYAEKVIRECNFDSSHDMQHFVNVYHYVLDIINHLDFPEIIEGIPCDDAIKLLSYAGFCHDLIDSKYVDSVEYLERLRKVFLENGYPEEYTEIIMFIIDNMSFSKQRKGVVIPERYRLAMDIVGDADKLDAYRPERVIAYQTTCKHDDPVMTRNWIKTILVSRVLEYKSKWLKTDYAKKLAAPLHEKVEQYVKENLENATLCDY